MAAAESGYTGEQATDCDAHGEAGKTVAGHALRVCFGSPRCGFRLHAHSVGIGSASAAKAT
jgi:hypothetical protein